MTKKDDWRLQGQMRYLKGAPLTLKPRTMHRPDQDHDHCEFCGAKFMELGTPGTIQDGYTTVDEYRWICRQCFEDFREMFRWEVLKPGEALR